ncbi:MAG: hypothetical protein HQL98_16165 [Magnetococcales bacterium]|nr:hypothetical protein [Magnetococcales bacterium]
MLTYADRIKETATVTGTGDYFLSGAIAGYRRFTDPFGGGVISYCAEKGRQWEVGEGVLDWGTNKISRTTILCSSNDGNPVDWGVDELVTISNVVTASMLQRGVNNVAAIIGKAGTLAISTGTTRWYPPQEMTFTSIDAWLGTASAGAAVNFTVRQNGNYSLFSGSIPAGSNRMAATAIPSTLMSVNNWFSLNITQIGTTTAGADLNVRFV